MQRGSKNGWILLLMMLAGVVIGRFLSEVLGKLPYFKWLSYGQTFGLTPPLALDLQIVSLQIGFTVHFTIAGILGIVIAFFLYRRM